MARDSDGELDEYDDDADEPALIPCPYCGAEILEDTPSCPVCERYLSDEDTPPARPPGWITLTVILCLLVVFAWLLW